MTKLEFKKLSQAEVDAMSQAELMALTADHSRVYSNPSSEVLLWIGSAFQKLGRKQKTGEQQIGVDKAKADILEAIKPLIAAITLDEVVVRPDSLTFHVSPRANEVKKQWRDTVDTQLAKHGVEWRGTVTIRPKSNEVIVGASPAVRETENHSEVEEEYLVYDNKAYGSYGPLVKDLGIQAADGDDAETAFNKALGRSDIDKDKWQAMLPLSKLPTESQTVIR